MTTATKRPALAKPLQSKSLLPSPEKEAAQFTQRFMAQTAQWDGGDTKPLLDYMRKDIEEAIPSKCGREQLHNLLSNYLDGQVPHFSSAVIQIFALERASAAKPIQGAKEATNDEDNEMGGQAI